MASFKSKSYKVLKLNFEHTVFEVHCHTKSMIHVIIDRQVVFV